MVPGASSSGDHPKALARPTAGSVLHWAPALPNCCKHRLQHRAGRSNNFPNNRNNAKTGERTTAGRNGEKFSTFGEKPGYDTTGTEQPRAKSTKNENKQKTVCDRGCQDSKRAKQRNERTSHGHLLLAARKRRVGVGRQPRPTTDTR